MMTFPINMESHRIPWFHQTQTSLIWPIKNPELPPFRLEVVAAVQASNSDAVVEGVGHHASERWFSPKSWLRNHPEVEKIWIFQI